MHRFVGASAVVCGLSSVALAQPLVGATEVAAERSASIVELTGAQFPQWSGGPELTARRPQAAAPTPLNPSDCAEQGTEWDPSGDHSCHQAPDVAVYGDPARSASAAPVERLLGYRWDADAGQFVQIPFQVDEKFTRYLSNNASGFAFYSGVDQHTTYAFDREPFRFVESGDATEDPVPTGLEEGEGIVAYDARCDSRPRPEGPEAAPDPLPGLDDNDEIVFRWADAGGSAAPAGEPLPAGIVDAHEITIVDPTEPGVTRTAYVMLAGESGPGSAYDASNGYVSYRRDPDADMFVFSESSYDNYGNAPQGPHCDPETGELVLDEGGAPLIRQRRPKDTTWVATDRYLFRYDGRWLMTRIHVDPEGDDARGTIDWLDPTASYGPDLIDRWKARAFQQDPSSETPCCGYEEEDTNWGGSTIILGEKAGPVRAIRETWGADSGTNVIRRETFYRDAVQYTVYLRVHVIPPLDGIYSQWDYNAGIAETYYNPMVPDGVPIDGQNDEVFGNLDDPCNPQYDGRGSDIDQAYRQIYASVPGLCDEFPYHQSVDLFDPSHSMVNATLQWEQVSGEHGTIVTRWSIHDPTPLGTAQGLVAVPYYRDDSCFDDGTGTNPGPRVRLRSSTETQVDRDGNPRRCWTPADGLPDEDAAVDPGQEPGGRPWPTHGDTRFFQGSIGTHGLHLLFLAESDNASTTVPVSEINSKQWQVILPGDPGGPVGEAYGRGFEKPLVATVAPMP